MISDIYQQILKLFSLDAPMSKIIVHETTDSG